MSEDPKMLAKMEALGLDQPPESFIEALPAPIKRRVEVLKELQSQKDELEAQFRKERAELEAKYDTLYGPLYQQRSAIVSGEKAVPPKGDEPAGEDSKGIPDFWLTCLMKCDITADMVKEKDLDVLKHLRDITSEAIFEDGKPRGFKLRFLFDANPFFSNPVLEKTYFMLPDDEGVLERAEGTAINWSPGKDVTVKILKKKPKKGGKHDSKPQTKTEKVESFFNFFDPPQVPGEDEDVDEEQMEELQAVIETDYEVGATVREKIISNAVKWFTGEAMEDDGGFFFGPDDEDEDFEGDEGEDDEDEDEDGAAGDKTGAPAQQPPECKQQ